MAVPPEPGFSDKQSDAILKRAIDLQAQHNASRLANASEAVSMEQLVRAAEELGVDAQFVRRAADEVAARPVLGKPSDASAPTLLERTFPVALTEADFPALLEHLRTASKSAGSAQVVGGTLEWTTAVPLRGEMLHVVVVPSEASTTVRIRSTNPFQQLAKPQRAFIPMAVLILVMGVIPSASFGFKYFHWTQLIPFVAIAAFVLAIPRFTFGRFFKRGGRQADELMDSLARWMAR